MTNNRTLAKNQNVAAVPTSLDTGLKNSVTRKANVQLKAAEMSQNRDFV